MLQSEQAMAENFDDLSHSLAMYLLVISILTILSFSHIIMVDLTKEEAKSNTNRGRGGGRYTNNSRGGQQ